ncbi:MAG: LytR/AlgR family response regulator transcription factor [Bacteroidia bacterium]
MSSKVRCIILDDELPGLTYMKMLCEQFPFVEVERCFNSPEAFLKDQQNLSYDVCLLDVNMPNISGIEIAQVLSHKLIIFISAHPEFAVNAYELEALDFIKKPVTKDRLEKALLRAQKLLGEHKLNDSFTWNTSIGKSAVYFEEILFITTSDIDKRDKLVFLQNDNQLVLKNITIEKLLGLLPKKEFIQVNKSDILTKKAIQAYTAEEIVLRVKHIPKATISLGDSFRKNFIAWLG